MKHHGCFALGGQPGDHSAFARRVGVTLCRQHHTQGSASIPIQLHVFQTAGLGSSPQHIQKVRFEAHQNRLGLGVSHAAVEFERLDLALRVDHQSGIQEAGVRNTILLHSLERGQDDLAHGAGMDLGRDHRCGRIGTHAARVGALVAVQQALVVLAGGQWHHILAITQDHEAGLFAIQKFLDHHARHGLPALARVVHHPQRVVEQHEVNGGVGFIQRHRHDHALASRQAIGLDDDGRTHAFHIGMRLHRVSECLIRRRGDAVALHECLGKRLGAFQLRGRPSGTEYAQPMGAEFVHHTGRQRTFGADHGHADLVLVSPLAQRHHVGDGHVLESTVQRSATIARRHVNHLNLVRLRQLPGKSVFTPAATNHQNIHTGLRLNRIITPCAALIALRCGKSPGCHPGLPAHPAAFACAPLHRWSTQSCFLPAW